MLEGDVNTGGLEGLPKRSSSSRPKVEENHSFASYVGLYVHCPHTKYYLVVMYIHTAIPKKLPMRSRLTD